MKVLPQSLRAALLSLLLLVLLTGLWYAATLPKAVSAPSPQDEYAQLMGKASAAPRDDNRFPSPLVFARVAATLLAHPFADNGPNDKGVGLQLAASLVRVACGYALALLVALPLGLLIGMSPLCHAALDPFIQVLKPISPLAWMPIALYTIKDAGISGIFVIFICSVWPMLLNTAFGVASVRREWLNVAATLEVSLPRRIFLVILPAALPTIVTGMRISMGVAWLVIVAAEMLVGGTGIGYFVWNEWNNLSLPSVIFAILLIGITGMVLDAGFGWLQRRVQYAD